MEGKTWVRDWGKAEPKTGGEEVTPNFDSRFRGIEDTANASTPAKQDWFNNLEGKKAELAWVDGHIPKWFTDTQLQVLSGRPEYSN